MSPFSFGELSMIGWIQLREKTLHAELRRLPHSDFVPPGGSRWELEKQVAEKTEALRVANRHLLLDLADRMKAEVALRDSELQLRAVFENALDGMLLLDN